MKAIAPLCVLTCLMISGCSSVPQTPEDKAVLTAEVHRAIAIFKTNDPSIQKFFDRSYGYAVLPKVFKGGFWAGGAYGRGHVFEKGNAVGFCTIRLCHNGLAVD